MPTFAASQPLTAQITYALMQLRAARYDGSLSAIHVAQRRLDRLIDKLPR